MLWENWDLRIPTSEEKLSEEMSGSKDVVVVSGRTSEKRKRTDALRFEWEIVDFVRWAEDEKYDVIASREFTISGCWWRLFLNTETWRKKGVLRTVIGMVPPLADDKSLSYAVGVKSWNGAVNKEKTGSKVFRKADKMCSVDLPDMRVYRKSPDNSLTIVCSLEGDFPNATGGVSRSSQTSDLAGSDGLARDMENLLYSGDASDATVLVRQKEFHVHRAVLAARTPVFSAMFRHDTTEKASGMVNLQNCEPDTFRGFLQYVYTGSVDELTPENASDLYEVAKMYQVDGLMGECLDCIKGGLSVESFCSAIYLALKHEENELTTLCLDFLAKNMKKVIQTQEWQNMLSDNPIQANELMIRAFGNSDLC